MRLAKYLARAGVASRRGAERLVDAGTGHARRGPWWTTRRWTWTRAARVAVDGRAVQGEAEHVVYALHKPTGVVSTASDTHGRRTVVDLVARRARLYPVGRLDVDSSGLILLTNDGDLANA